MPKQEHKRANRRKTLLVRLAQEDLERFEVELERRLCSWADEIRRRAEEEGAATKPVFAIVKRAHETLSACGENVMTLYGRRTMDFLENLCCRALAPQIGPEIYRLNQLLDRRHEAPPTRRQHSAFVKK
jgi:hypothetical protein